MSDTGREIVVRGPASAFAQQIEIGVHRLIADEPTSAGGVDAGPDPYALLCASLGACTSMTIGLVARQRQWPLDSVTVRLRHGKVHAEDCADCEKKPRKIDRIERDIELFGPLTDEQRAALLDIADRCPVHRTLTSDIQIHTRLLNVDGAAEPGTADASAG